MLVVVLHMQMWDTRVPGRRLQRFSAHYGPVFSVDWHPTERWLATGGRDKMIRVIMLNGTAAVHVKPI